MFAQHSRSALLAGLLIAAAIVPAVSAENDTVKPDAAADRPVAMAASPQSGPVLARESLATETGAHETIEVGANQPTRGAGNPTTGRRYAATRSGYERSSSHRHGLILGIGY